MDAGECTLLVNNHRFNLKVFPLPVQIEEQTKIEIDIPSGWQLDSAWIEGVNMFMGRMKVFIDSRLENGSGVTNVGSFFLGSCTQPDMTWRIVLKIYKDGKATPEFLEYHFATSIN